MSALIAVVWLGRDDKTYFYGPFGGQEELAAGMLWLSALWSDKIAAGAVGLYPYSLSAPPWLKAPTDAVQAGLPQAPWLRDSRVQGYPVHCEDRPYWGEVTCALLAGHSGGHQTKDQSEEDE